MTTDRARWEAIRDGAQIGALFGAVAGIGVLGLVLGWGLLARLGSKPPSFGHLLAVHAANVVGYAILGAGVAILWPLRRHRAGRILVWTLIMGAGTLTLVSLDAGAVWRWPIALWPKFLLAAIAFGVVFGWSGGRPPAAIEPKR